LSWPRTRNPAPLGFDRFSLGIIRHVVEKEGFMDREEVGSRAIEFVRRCGIRAGLGFATADAVAALVFSALEAQRNVADHAEAEPLRDEREFVSYLRSQLLWRRLHDVPA